MHPELREFLEDLPRILVIDNPLSYRWFGIERKIHQPDNVVVSEMPIDEMLQSSISRVFYNHVYRSGGPEPVKDWPTSSAESAAFMEACSASNHLDSSWQHAVALISTDADGSAVIDIGGVTVRCKPGDWRQTSDGLAVRAGNEDRYSQPGAYFALGGQQGNDNVMRLYWNIPARHLPVLVDASTRILPDAGITFNLKAFSGRPRCDSAVIYLSRDSWDDAIEPITRVYEKVQPYMSERVPFLTKPLAVGLGVADDPGGGGSFGQSRMGAIASTVVQAFRDDTWDPTEFPSYASEKLSQAGFDVREPHRFHASSRYEPLNVEPLPKGRTATGSFEEAPPKDAIALLASRLCEEATHVENTSNWHPSEIQDNASYGMLDHTLYGGSMGIALFLHEAGRLLDDVRTTEVARNAARAALIRASNAENDEKSGSFYTGSMGTAIGGLRIGIAHDDDDLVQRSENLAQQLVETVEEFGADDLLGGRAGFVLAALALDSVLDNPLYREGAMEQGNVLLELQERVGEEPGQAWTDPRDTEKRPLLGISHGASGFALALSALADATGDERFATATEDALAYEDYWWELTNSWPDFRGEGIFPGQESDHSSDMLAWCHGGAGALIARTELRRLGANVRQDVFDSAEDQVRTSLNAANGISLTGSLCHSNVGNADCLLEASGDRTDETVSRVARITAGQIFEGIDQSMPKGLMTGLAGLGYFLCRSIDPTIPTVLLPSSALLQPKTEAK